RGLSSLINCYIDKKEAEAKAKSRKVTVRLLHGYIVKLLIISTRVRRFWQILPTAFCQLPTQIINSSIYASNVKPQT
ncbi:MAG: hypothetical protein V5A47_12675, partial [Bacteroidales bacterium]